MSIVLPMPMIAKRLPFWSGQSKRSYSTYATGMMEHSMLALLRSMQRVQAAKFTGACVTSLFSMCQRTGTDRLDLPFETVAPAVQGEHTRTERCEEHRVPRHGLLNTAELAE